MNKGIIRLISTLVALAVLSGCTSLAQPIAGSSADGAILSAAEAQAQIVVTVRTPEPVELEPVDETSLIAAAD